MEFDLSKWGADKNLSEAEASVLKAMVSHGPAARDLGVRGIAAECFTSTSTVMRLAHKLGYRGFTDMCYQLELAVANAAKARSAGASEPALSPGVVLTPPVREAIAASARRLHRVGGFVHIYGCGFSSIAAEYLSKKLLGLGVRVIFSSADDSISIFENNLDRTDSLIVVTRSGRTPYVLKRVRVASEEGICTIAFTGNSDNPVRQECDIAIVADDENPLDDRNTEPSLFFARTLMLMEYLVKEYLEQEQPR